MANDDIPLRDYHQRVQRDDMRAAGCDALVNSLPLIEAAVAGNLHDRLDRVEAHLRSAFGIRLAGAAPDGSPAAPACGSRVARARAG